jgi:hypothetical protein
VVLLSKLSSSLPPPSPAVLPYFSVFLTVSSNILSQEFLWFLVIALLPLLPTSCLSDPLIYLSTFSTASLIAPPASDSSSLTQTSA